MKRMDQNKTVLGENLISPKMVQLLREASSLAQEADKVAEAAIEAASATSHRFLAGLASKEAMEASNVALMSALGRRDNLNDALWGLVRTVPVLGDLAKDNRSANEAFRGAPGWGTTRWTEETNIAYAAVVVSSKRLERELKALGIPW